MKPPSGRQQGPYIMLTSNNNKDESNEHMPFKI